MREIDVSIIEKTVEELFVSANAELPVSLENLIKEYQVENLLVPGLEDSERNLVVCVK